MEYAKSYDCFKLHMQQYVTGIKLESGLMSLENWRPLVLDKTVWRPSKPLSTLLFLQIASPRIVWEELDCSALDFDAILSRNPGFPGR